MFSWQVGITAASGAFLDATHNASDVRRTCGVKVQMGLKKNVDQMWILHCGDTLHTEAGVSP